jgi:DMSO/TMAO reductase YedYZ molybdopterin-dependent catalytic subunit
MNRRHFLAGGAAALGTSLLSGCNAAPSARQLRDVFESAERLTMWVQRALLSNGALAREFTEADLSPTFRANGTTFPETREYEALVASRFADWRLGVGGLVERPLMLSLADLQQLTARTQITRHDCVEGWSCIGKWKGPQLGTILDLAGLRPEARYIVFHCADSLRSGIVLSPYYESIDLIDAYHPQTILAYEMNDQPLPVAHGAPLRLRLERQLGYKMAKYIMRIEAVESLAGIWGGKGGFWEDAGYEWYAGI